MSPSGTAPDRAKAPPPKRPSAAGVELVGATPKTPVEKFTRWLSRSSVQIVLVIVALFWMMPTIGLLITSLRPAEAFARTGWWQAVTEPSQLTLENYTSLLGDSDLIDAVLSTFYIAIPSTVLPVFMAALAGYALAWIPFKGRDTLFLILVGLLVVPLQMALIPAFSVFRTFGLSGLPALWLFHTAFGLPLAIFLMRNYFAGLPGSLIEAARIDGASEWKIFLKVILPLGFPALASLTIFQFTWTWNDLLVALVFSTKQQPITLFLRDRLGEFSTGIGVISPGVFLSAIVPLIIFFAFQRYFEAGLLGGSVK
jgi:alpha-glucoside transport system permease protein